jgi:hypothetical protein
VTPSPPAAPASNIGLASIQDSDGRALFADHFDVLDVTGRRVQTVSREVAAEILDAGLADGIGRTCVKYLRLRVEVAGRSRTSLRTWIGSTDAGHIRPAVYAHDDQACTAYRADRRTGRI